MSLGDVRAVVGARWRSMDERADLVLVSSGLGSKLGGIGRVSEDIVRALAPRYQVAVVASAPEAAKSYRALELCVRLLARAWRRPRFVLYEHRGLATVHGLVPAIRRVPYGIFLHGFEIWHPLTPSQRRIVEGAALLLANSHTTVEEARRHNPWLPAVTVVQLGVGVDEEALTPRETSPLAVLVGRVDADERFKGHDEILDAWPSIRQAVPDARFVAIGGGTDVERMRRRAHAERLQGVEFTGFVSPEIKRSYLRQARAAFALGRVEGFGLANVEAAARGIALVGLPGTVLEELFPGSQGVRFVRSLSPQDVADAVSPLLGDANLAAEVGRAGQQRVLSCYTRAHFEQRIAAVLAPVIETSRGKGLR